MICGLIGSTKIAEAHLRELIKNGAKEIVIISRSKKKSLEIYEKFKKKFSKVKISTSKIEILKQKNFDLIDICSTTQVHDEHLKYISRLNSIIVVEKPIISLLKYKEKYIKFLKQLYRSNEKIIVCYPMLYLSEKFKKIFDFKKQIKIFKFDFLTGGKYKGKKICIDLMPHALSFVIKFFNNFNFKNNKFLIKSVIIKKNDWKCEFIFQKIKFNFRLSEKLGRKTSLSIRLNDQIIKRKTKYQNKKFVNYLEYKKKIKLINNPMSEFFADLFKNKQNKSYYNNNKELTLCLMEKNYQFLKTKPLFLK
jgi:hypothetical protein